MKLTDFFSRRHLPEPALPQPPTSPVKMNKTHARILQKWGEGTIQTNGNLAEEVWVYWQEKRLAELGGRKIRKIANLMFGADAAAERLRQDREFIREYLKMIEQQDSRTIWRALIISYLTNYKPESKPIAMIAKCLSENRTLLPNGWPKVIDEVNLFDVRQAPQHVADFIFSRDDKIASLLDGIALDDRSAGMMEYVRRQIAEKIRDEVIKRGQSKFENMSRFHKWITNESNKIGDAFREASMIGLIGPMVKGESHSLMSKKSEKLLLETYGDPRIPEERVGWPGPEEYIRMFIRRLNSGILERFLRIIQRTVHESSAVGMWTAREEFWRAKYLDKIDDALIICGRAARELLEQERMMDPDDYDLPYSRLQGGEREQSVLLMKIGDMTVAEWSHNGSCRIWKKGNRSAPEFTRDEELSHDTLSSRRSNSDCRIPHLGGTWKYKIQSCLDNTDYKCS